MKNIVTLSLFALIALIAIRHTGEVKDGCKAGWKAPVGPACIRDEKVASDVAKKPERISNLDLVLPGILFGLSAK